MAKSLREAFAAGLRRPPSIKAALQQWLGVPITLTNGQFWHDYAAAMLGSWTGVPVTEEHALRLATAGACIRLISETIATLPMGFYRRKADGSREPATGHPLYEILHNQPNANTTADLFWQVNLAAMLMRGNTFAEIKRGGNDVVVALDFLYPAQLTRKVSDSGTVSYVYLTADGKTREISGRNIMHTPAFSVDGKTGISPLAYGVNVLGTAIATDKTSAETFANSMKSPGLVKMTETYLNPKQREELRQHVNTVARDGGMMVLEKGAGFEKIGFDPVTSELLASRRWNAEEICRLYGVDPALVGITGKDSNWGTGLEQKMQWLVTLTLRKWCVRIEQSIRKNLLTPVEKQIYFAEFALEGLLRGDSAARGAFYSTMTQNGIYTRDECRVLENKPPKGGNAAVLTVQANMLPLDKLGQQQQQQPQPAPAPGPNRPGVPTTQEEATDENV